MSQKFSIFQYRAATAATVTKQAKEMVKIGLGISSGFGS
jgi:hypothetical protein